MLVSSEDFKVNEFKVPQRNQDISDEVTQYLDS